MVRSPPTSVSLLPTFRENFLFDEYLEFLYVAQNSTQICMPSPKFEPRTYGRAVRVPKPSGWLLCDVVS
ncbi:hypothetical protein TNCV_88461 [Trichonephila clavipes]|nr:hypothetical protein TNCV_88461 [Trichonephila clavipes]